MNYSSGSKFISFINMLNILCLAITWTYVNTFKHLLPPKRYDKEDLNVIRSGEKASELPELVFKGRYILFKK